VCARIGYHQRSWTKKNGPSVVRRGHGSDQFNELPRLTLALYNYTPPAARISAPSSLAQPREVYEGATFTRYPPEYCPGIIGVLAEYHPDIKRKVDIVNSPGLLVRVPVALAHSGSPIALQCRDYSLDSTQITHMATRSHQRTVMHWALVLWSWAFLIHFHCSRWSVCLVGIFALWTWLSMGVVWSSRSLIHSRVWSSTSISDHTESRGVYYVHFSCNIWVILVWYFCDTWLIPGWYSGGYLVRWTQLQRCKPL
jgi:hypothetical protein